jgi:hypothetical protein
MFNNGMETVDRVMANPLVMIARDIGHPLNAGTSSRILARYVREQGRLSRMDATRKLRSTPSARRKERLQEGVDADDCGV